MVKKFIGLILISLLFAGVHTTSLAYEYEYKGEEVKLPEEIEQSCTYYASLYGLAPEFVEGIIWVESRGIKDVRNGSCIGICQINLDSQKDRLYSSMELVGTDDPYDYDAQIRTCCSLLYDLYWISADEVEDLIYVTAAYNGQSKARENSEKGIISSYSQKVLDVAYIFEEQHGKHQYDIGE